MKTTRQVSELTALLSRFVHAAMPMPWGLCSRCGWCLVPVPCLVPVRALIVSSFNPSPASRHTQPAHGDSAVFFSDSDIGLLSWLALSFDDPSCHTPYPVYVSCLSALLLHLRLRCIDSPAQSTPQPFPCPLFNTIPSILILLLLLFSYVFTWTVRVHTRTPPSFQPGCFSHLTNPGLAFASPHASPRFNSTHLPFDIPLSIHPPTAPRTLVRLFVW